MSQYKTNSIIRSFIIVPLLTTAISMNAFTASLETALQANMAVEVQETLSPEALVLQQEREKKAAKIDAYYAKNNMPLKGYGMKMVVEAEKHKLDWRLLPALSVRESTGGKFACKSATFSAFGYGSCKINFKSYDHSIELIAETLGGNNDRAGRYYRNKDIYGILKTYNSVIPAYTTEIFSIMAKIENTVI